MLFLYRHMTHILYTDAEDPRTGASTEDSSTNVYIAITVILVILLVVISVLLAFVFYKYRRLTKQRSRVTSAVGREPAIPKSE